jgi:hypothetical protein
MRSLSYLLVTVSVISIMGCSSSTPPAKLQYACPDWSSDPVSNYDNKDFSNFGCAYYNNLSVQLENPADLQGGHGVQTSSPDRESVVIQKYMSATQENPPSLSPGGSSSSSSR